jgi:Fe-S-cluster-containing dehydrogenase component
MQRILVSSEICSGCRACEVTCVARHEGGFGVALSRIKVTKLEPQGHDVPAVCRRCRRPGCVEACPTGALWRDENLGVIRLRAEECLGCGACVDGCPFGMVTLRPSDSLPLICDLCEGDPACVRRCATGAIRWGDEQAPARARREALARKAAERQERPAGERPPAGGGATAADGEAATPGETDAPAAAGPRHAEWEAR